MTIGLTYDLRSEYLALGYTEDETAEFDRDDTIEAIESALQALGHRTERVGNAKQLAAALVGEAALGPGFQYCRGNARYRTGGPGTGLVGSVRDSLYLFRSPGHVSDPAQGHDQACRSRCRCADRRLSWWPRPRIPESVSFEPPLFCKTRGRRDRKGRIAGIHRPGSRGSAGSLRPAHHGLWPARPCGALICPGGSSR